MNKINKKENGYAVLELLFYISFFALLSLVVINAMVTMAKSFRETEIQSEFLRGSAIMERISREVRQANSINTISGSSLKLNSTEEDGDPKTVEFSLSGSNVLLLENNILTGNLNTPNLNVSTLSFTEITTTAGKAVKIILSIQSTHDIQARVVDFYDTVVLRGSY
jgi:hypothetical protein